MAISIASRLNKHKKEHKKNDSTKKLFPQPNKQRSEWLNLNGTWEFSLNEKKYDKAIEVPYPWGSPLSGITDEVDGTGYYRKSVEWNPENRHVWLVFGAVDLREEARENALAYGATEVFHPDELTSGYYLNWQNWTSPDLTRDGHKADIFNLGFQNVMEFTGTPDGLALAGDMVCAHGRLGIGGFHNDCPRTVDFKLWNMKAMDKINCHERRIEHEADLCRRALELISKGIWKFTGLTKHIYGPEEFDAANYDMETHRDNFIKGAVEF